MISDDALRGMLLEAAQGYYAHRGGPGAALVAAEDERRALLTDRPVTAVPVQ